MYKSQRDRKAVWLPLSVIAKLKQVSQTAKLGFSNPRKVIEYLIAQHKVISDIRIIIADYDIESDDALQRIIDLVN